MMELLNLKALKRHQLSGLLGLALDGSRLYGVALRRANGSLEVQQSFSVLLTLDPLTADAELVGREIRNHLDAAGVREHHCVLGLPLKWALTTHVEVPKLEEEDAVSFLQLEAERGFPCDVTTLMVANSRCQLAAGKQYAMLVGIPRNHLEVMERVLRAARLKPVSFSLGLTALQPASAASSQGTLALVVGETHVGLQITCGGGVAALRMLEGALELEGSRKVLQPDLVAREARITLGQLPAELRDSVRQVRVFGPRDLGQQLADEMELRLEAMGLKVEFVTRHAEGEFGLRLPADAPISPALSLAANRLAERAGGFEFLPPRVTQWQQLTARYSSSKLRTAGAAAAAAALVVAGIFLFQQWQLMSLGSQWNKMAARVAQIKDVQQQIVQYRSWYDEPVRSLTILKQLTQAFPEDGVVTAKSVEIRDANTVTCSGVARDYQALLRTIDQLRASKGISEVKVSTIRGKSPMQFTFSFNWNEGGRSEN